MVLFYQLKFLIVVYWFWKPSHWLGPRKNLPVHVLVCVLQTFGFRWANRERSMANWQNSLKRLVSVLWLCFRISTVSDLPALISSQRFCWPYGIMFLSSSLFLCGTPLVPMSYCSWSHCTNTILLLNMCHTLVEAECTLWHRFHFRVREKGWEEVSRPGRGGRMV